MSRDVDATEVRVEFLYAKRSPKSKQLQGTESQALLCALTINVNVTGSLLSLNIHFL